MTVSPVYGKGIGTRFLGLDTSVILLGSEHVNLRDDLSHSNIAGTVSSHGTDGGYVAGLFSNTKMVLRPW